MPPKSCAPTEFDKAYRACIIGIKAFQNVFGSLRFFQRLENLYATHENTLISSVFQTGVIRYAKPFTKSYLNNVNMRYPLENVETGLGFSKDIHDHLIKIRDTLIAHDDFDEIHPRLLLPGLKPEGCNVFIPLGVFISNKCISHPSVLQDVEKLTNHTKNTAQLIQERLFQDLAAYRAAVQKYPEEAKEKEQFSEKGDSVTVPAEGMKAKIPDRYRSSPWLNVPEPTYSESKKGFCYETVNVQWQISEPEIIELPNGDTMHITPPTK